MGFCNFSLLLNLGSMCVVEKISISTFLLPSKNKISGRKVEVGETWKWG